MEWKPQPLLLTFGLDGCFEGCSVPVSIEVGIGLHCGICTWRERMLEGKEQKEQKNPSELNCAIVAINKTHGSQLFSPMFKCKN